MEILLHLFISLVSVDFNIQNDSLWFILDFAAKVEILYFFCVVLKEEVRGRNKK